MKRIFILLLMAAVTVMMVSSCKDTLPARFDRFVNYVEKNCETFSKSDWDKASDQFSQLMNEYTENYNTFNSDQRKQINAAITKYAGLAATSGVKSALRVVTDLVNQLPSFIDTISNFLKELGSKDKEE